jgi:hypothetical protein
MQHRSVPKTPLASIARAVLCAAFAIVSLGALPGRAEAAKPAALTTAPVPYTDALDWVIFVTNLNLPSAADAGACNVVVRVVGDDGIPLADISTTVPAGGRTDPFEGSLPDPGAVSSIRFEYAVPKDANQAKYCSLRTVLVSAFVRDSNGLRLNPSLRNDIFVPGRTYTFKVNTEN